jgi:adenylate kinase family enzyme
VKKVAVIGCGGAGKSTLSRVLSEELNIPVYHLDRLYWKPGWIPTENDEWEDILRDLISKEEWILDGNFSRTLDIRIKNADTVIFLNMPMYLCLYRIIKRRFMYIGKTRPDMNEGCPEKIDLDFVKWVCGYNKNQKSRILDKLDMISKEKNVIILNSSSEVSSFILNLKSNKV